MLLNLHTHSNYSDGCNSLGELVSAFKDQGHACLCLTDHDYAMTLESYERQRKEAAELEKVNEFPIICGIETSTGFDNEEALLFGTEACREWLSLRRANNLMPVGCSWFEEGQFLKWAKHTRTEKALVLCHPLLQSQIEDFYSIFDGYEIMNSGCLWPETKVALMKRLMPKAKAFKNFDLHTLTVFWGLKERLPCNEVSEDISIRNETDLIRYIKG